MLSLLLPILFMADTLSHESAAADVLPSDTLREVVVTPDSLLPVERAIRESLRRHQQPHTTSLGEMLEKLSPGLNDKILHPTAFKQRRREGRRRRVLKTLEEYDRVRTFDELLREAYEQQLQEDSLSGSSGK